MNEQKKKVLEIVERAIECKLYSSEKTFQEYRYTSGWLTRPYAVISQIVRGRSGIVMRGRGKITRNSGETIYIPAGTWRKSIVLDKEGTTFIWARLSFTIFSGIDVLSFFEVPKIFRKDTGEMFYGLLEQLIEAVQNDREMSVFEQAARKQKIMYELLHAVMERSRIKENSFYTISRISRLAPVLSFINSNFNKTIAVDDIAELAHLSKSQFHRNFKKAFNVSPAEYQKLLRLKEAQKLLTLTDSSIAETAERTGYGDQFHFSRIFKKHFGMSPLKFRQSNTIDKIGI